MAEKVKKLAFVTPWYGENIPGGAEMELRGIATHLHESGIDVEILTTCVEQFMADWNTDHYEPGIYEETGLTVRRFAVRKRDTNTFNKINEKLMRNIEVSEEEGRTFLQEMVNSTDLYRYIRENKSEYDLFIFIPYMFGTTFYGIKECYDKSVVIPCFHDEAYIYLKPFKEVFEKVQGMIFLAHPEQELAEKTFDLQNANCKTLGAGVDTDFTCDPEAFRKKFNINEPFILYAGRKDAGKNVDVLVKYFTEYKKRHKDNNTKLVLIGGGSIGIPSSMKNEIIDLGFVDKQDKYNAYAAAMVMCQPSTHESFSIVVMESWLAKRPVLVHSGCEVTKDFAKRVNGGLYFEDYWEFEGCIEYFENNPEICRQMGLNGREFVLENFAWPAIVRNYTAFFEEIINFASKS